jgi:phage shock protein PspC (stress-responsive transcriptional regulator)
MAQSDREPHDEVMAASIQPPQPTPPLRRPLADRAFAGVSAGLAQRFNVSPAWFRVGFVLLALFGGLGFVLYALGWILIPDEGSDVSILQDWIDGFDASNSAMVIGVVLIAIAAITFLTSFHLMSGKFVLAAILLVIGVLLYRGDLGGSKKPHGTAGPPEDTAPIGASNDGDSLDGEIGSPANRGPGVSVDTGADFEDSAMVADTVTATTVDAPAVPSAPAPAPVPVRPPKPRSILGRLTLAATLIAVGGLALLDVAGALFPDPAHYLAVALGVVGGGLLIGTFFGQARWLIFVGLFLIPFLVVASVVSDWTFTGEAGDRYVRVETLVDLEEAQYDYVHTAGVLELDLRWFEPPADASGTLYPIAIDARVTAGELRILLPDDVSADVRGSAGMGSVDLFGDQSAGIGVSRDAVITSSITDVAFLIDARTDLGSVVVDVLPRENSVFRWEG